MLLRSDVDRPSWRLSTTLRLNMPSIELGVGACMRARGISGHERRELGREDEDPLVAIDYDYLKLDGTEDDDEDDEVAQNKLLILVARDVKTGTSAATCLREKGVSEYATSWLVSLLC